MSDRPRRPQAFRVGPGGIEVDPPAGPRQAGSAAADRRRAVIEIDEPPEAEVDQALAREARVPASGRGPRFARLLVGALGGLITLAIGLWVDQLVRALFARADWLGWLALGLAGLAVFALAAIVAREISGLMRLARIDRLRQAVETASRADDEAAARRLAAEIAGLYAGRPETARGRAALAAHMREVVEGRDLLLLTEREILAPLDAAAQRLVSEAAQRVSVVTAISPKALVDVAFVLYENVRLIRRLSDLYGGRPGTLGFVGFVGRVLSHLGVTGSMAIGDTLVQQVVGQGLAAKLSARLGEGIVNGVLTARIGLAALDLVRPMPHEGLPKPRLAEIMRDLTRRPGGGDAAAG